MKPIPTRERITGHELRQLTDLSSILQKEITGRPNVTRLYLIREHRLHGIVTGMESVKIMSSLEDQLDRLLVSFKDAKVSHQP